MHDIKAIRAEPDAFDAALARRNIAPASAALLRLDAERRDLLTRAQAGQTERNAIARQIGQARREGADTAALEARGGALRAEAERAEAEAARLDGELRALLSAFPNRLDADVPAGADEAANVELKRVGTPRAFGFKPLAHYEIGERWGAMDFALAARLAGSRFTVLRGILARLERALGQFMLDIHTAENGYVEHSVPLLVNAEALHGTGQLPKFADDLFRTTDGRWLIPTAEVPLTNAAAGEIIPLAHLPLRLTALTPCFRSEAGSAGRDVRGMLRQHQFAKVELVSTAAPEESEAEHERMTRAAEGILERLELPYRRILLCAGDTGFGAAKTFDLEVWLPGQNDGQGAYREISSCSNTRDFQARRMNARLRAADGKSLAFVHTLNGSGVAVGRALIAVLENHQREDGRVSIPPALRPYLGGQESIGA